MSATFVTLHMSAIHYPNFLSHPLETVLIHVFECMSLNPKCVLFIGQQLSLMSNFLRATSYAVSIIIWF